MVAVTRAGVVRLDFGDLVGQDGDVIHLMVTDTALERLNARLGGHPSPRPPGSEDGAPALDGVARRAGAGRDGRSS